MNGNRGLGIVLGSQIFSTLATWWDMIAMMLIVGFTWRATPLAMGVVMMCFSGSMTLFSVVGGPLAAKLGRKNIMIIASLARAVLVLLLLQIDHVLWQLCLIVVVKGFFIAVFPGGVEGKIQEMGGATAEAGARKSEWIEATAKWVAPLSGGLVVYALGATDAYYVVSAMFGVSVLLALLVPADRVQPQDSAPADTEGPEPTLQDGKRFLHGTNVLFAAFLIVLFASLFVTVADSQLTILFRDLQGAAIWMIGVVMASSGLATWIMGMWLGRVARFHKLVLWVAIAGLGVGVALGGAGLFYNGNLPIEQFWLICLAFFLGGVSWQTIFVPFNKELERRAGKRLLPQVMMYIGVVVILEYSLAPLFGGLLVTWIGVGNTFELSGLILLVISVLTLLFSSTLHRQDVSTASVDSSQTF